jgi:hypothetical protein
MNPFYMIVLGLLLAAGASLLVIYFVNPSLILPTKTKSTFLASAARGDVLKVEILDATLNYQNITQEDTTVTTLPFTLQNDYVTFASPTFSRGLLFPGDYLLLGSTKLGPGRNETGLAIGLVPKPYTEIAFPKRLYNFIQFRMLNRGYEVGYIDCTSTGADANKVWHESWDPSMGSTPGERQDLSQRVKLDQMHMSEDKLSIHFVEMNQGEPNPIRVFQTLGDDLVLDMNNGGIYAMPTTTDKVRDGVYRGLSYAKDNAQSGDNTETGTPQIKVCSLVVSNQGTHIKWLEGETTPTTLFEADFQAAFPATFSRDVPGKFYATRITQHVSVINGTDGKLLCGFYDSFPTLEPMTRDRYAYRHAAFKWVSAS